MTYESRLNWSGNDRKTVFWCRVKKRRLKLSFKSSKLVGHVC